MLSGGIVACRHDAWNGYPSAMQNGLTHTPGSGNDILLRICFLINDFSFLFKEESIALRKITSLFKRIMALFFLMTFTMQTFSKTIMMIDYRVNQQAYAKNCVNKFRPKLHCNGHCQLMKQIEEDEKKSQQHPERKLEFKNEITLSSKSFFPELTFITLVIPSIYSNITMGTAIKRPRSVFHPPALCLNHIA